jgi:membrane fusion protein, macrolide-specific efflux system
MILHGVREETRAPALRVKKEAKVTKNHILRTITIATLAVLLGGCFLLPKEEEILAPPIMEPPEIAYKTIAVVRKDIEDAIRVSGYFVYAEQESVQFRSASGRLENIYVEYAEIVQKGQLLAKLVTNNIELRIRQQEIAVRKQELNLERKKLTGADRFDIESTTLDLELAKLSLQQTMNELETSLLRSPMDGEVVYITNASEGDFIDSYKTMFQIADRSKLYLSYTGNNLSDFRLGMIVTVTYEDTAYVGEVVMTPAQFPFDAPESQRRQILFEVEGLPDSVKKGESARVELILQRSENTLVIPRSQVQRYLGRMYVYVLEDNVRVERNIATGIETATEVEVTEGLEEGELIVLR